ncbi:MAG: hypothetical protein AB7I42_30075 [Bradyrhizobium sp.]|uniref:hypothetical protein n=1 Tax=Bradyrhizobium sp. TaxID=376 RepID=UPI003D104F7E
MSALVLVLGLVLQAQQPAPQPQPPPLRSEGVGGRTITPAHDTYEREFRLTTPAARAELHGFAGCVVGRSRELAIEVLGHDFTTARYRNALRLLARNNERCFSRRRSLSASGLPFAGSLAEQLLSQNPTPLNVRLARAVAEPAPRAFSASDRISLCVVRSVPDDVARLLAAEMGSTEENDAVAALDLAVRACSQGGPRLETPPAGLRAILATAAFRTVQSAAQPSTEARN